MGGQEEDSEKLNDCECKTTDNGPSFIFVLNKSKESEIVSVGKSGNFKSFNISPDLSLLPASRGVPSPCITRFMS
jgi:hypothetical protein